MAWYQCTSHYGMVYANARHMMAWYRCTSYDGMVPMHVTLWHGIYQCTSYYGMVPMHITLWHGINQCTSYYGMVPMHTTLAMTWLGLRLICRHNFRNNRYRELFWNNRSLVSIKFIKRSSTHAIDYSAY